MSSRRKRARSQQHQNQNKGQKTQPWPQFNDVPPPPPPPNDASRVRIVPEPEQEQEPAPEPAPEPETPWWAAQEDAPPTGYAKSRYNSMKHGLRSMLIHPEEMQLSIDEKMIALFHEYRPTTTMQGYLVSEIARTTVQIKLCAKQVLIDQARAIERADTAFDADQAERAERWLKRLPGDPFAAARALERTKQGAQLLIFHWTTLREAAQNNGTLDEEQRTLAFDLLGIPHVARNGSRRVPEGTNGPALLALIDGELERLGALTERVLNGRDRAEQEAARLGVSRYQDAATRNVRNAESRLQKRLDWAMESLERLRKGVPASDIIDPMTKKAVDPGSCVPPASPPPTSPPPPTSTSPAQPAPLLPASAPEEDASAPDPTDTPVPIPEGCPEDMRDLLIMAGMAFRQMKAEEAAARAALTTPPDEAGPPSA